MAVDTSLSLHADLRRTRELLKRTDHVVPPLLTFRRVESNQSNQFNTFFHSRLDHAMRGTLDAIRGSVET